MFDVIAHKEGAKLLQKRFNLKEVEKYEVREDVKRKNPDFSWVPGLDFHRWTKTMIGTVNKRDSLDIGCVKIEIWDRIP